MKAIILKDFGGVDNLVIKEIPIPVLSENEVLVKVMAISVNPVDVKTRAGKSLAAKLKAFDPVILGWDISGIVTESRSPLFKKGDEVFGMVNFPGHGQAYAEYVAAPAAHLAVKPGNITHTEAAAATLAALTAFQMLTRHFIITKGQKVLIHAAAGGVGHYAVQLAQHLGAYVIGTSSAANRDFVMALGANEHIDYKSTRFEDVVENIDFVLDTIGGDNIEPSLKVIKKGGTLISIVSGKSETVTEKAAESGIIGKFCLVESSGEDMNALAALLENGSIKSHVSQIFPFPEMAKVHLQIESGTTKGKLIVLTNN
ncbi:MAG: NADP-dependent oxidoreductase [Ferruginibacter sp.]